MFATRSDQENLVHNHQQAAAAKPLNQGLKSHASKSQAPKTPFRIPLNDENAVGAGKSALKTNGKGKEAAGGGFTLKKSDNNGERNAFVTPAGPRNRAPLGMKTTNAKGIAFQTPAPVVIDNKVERSVQKAISPRLRRAKVKVHQAEAVTEDVDDDSGPEIEHVPPKEVPLPDYPESDTESESYFGPNKQYPMFEPENMFRGMYETYFDPIDEHGERASEKRERLKVDEYLAKQEKQMDEEAERERKEIAVRLRAEFGIPEAKAPVKAGSAIVKSPPPAAGQMLVGASKAKPTHSSVDKLSSRSAAAALAAPTKSSLARQQIIAAQATKAKAAGALKGRGALAAKPSNSISDSKQTAGVAASKSTVGYGKGRSVSSTMRRADGGRSASGNKATPLASMLPSGKDQENARPAMTKKVTDPVPSLASLGLDDTDEDDGLCGRAPLFEDDEDEVFQLQLSYDG